MKSTPSRDRPFPLSTTMSQLLTTRQAEELFVLCILNGFANLLRHKALIAYVTSIDLPDSAAVLRREFNLGDNFDAETCKKYGGLLEKKWTSVVRLQKKVGRLTAHRLYLDSLSRSWTSKARTPTCSPS